MGARGAHATQEANHDGRSDDGATLLQGSARPDQIRRDPPHRYLPVSERSNWRDQGIDMPSILLRDPEKLPVKVLLHSMYGGEIGGSEAFGRRYVLATKEGIDQLP